jgi:nucleotide-binding universal stress UspA family protein
MFKTLVVALDLDADGDRALPVVQALSRSGDVAVDLVTVSSPGLPSAVDTYELERRVRAHGWDRDSWTLVHDVDVARGLVQHAAHREDPLIVMATAGRRPWSSSMFGSIPHDVLRSTERPVLLVGPHVPCWYAPARTTLLTCLDAGETAARAVPAIVSWQQTFAACAPQIAEVASDRSQEAAARRRVGSFADLLAAHHLRAITDVLRDDDPVHALEQHAKQLDGAIFVATSARYTDGRLHWHSTTRDLVHRASRPVLVIPARAEPLQPTPRRAEREEHVAFRDSTVPGSDEHGDPVPAAASDSVATRMMR